MPGFLAHQGATALCAHGGSARPVSLNLRVMVGRQATAVVTAPWAVTGCPNPVAAGGPCVSARWTAGTTRVSSFGLQLVLQGAVATCAPSGAPATVTTVQSRVRGS